MRLEISLAFAKGGSVFHPRPGRSECDGGAESDLLRGRHNPVGDEIELVMPIEEVRQSVRYGKTDEGSKTAAGPTGEPAR